MDHSLVVMAGTLPIVGFVGFVDGTTTIGGGGTAVTGGGGVPVGGLLGGVVVIVSDFLFLVVWSVDCARYPIPCSLECQLCLISNSLLVVVHVHSAICCCWLLPCDSAILVSCARANEANVTTSS